MKGRKRVAFLLAGVMAASLLLGGCGEKMDSEEIALTCGDEDLTLGYMNFVAHYNQASYDSFFASYYGEDYWTNEAYADEDGLTMEDSVKASLLEEIELQCVLDQHRDDYGIEITDEEIESMYDAGNTFMEENDRKAINAMGATEDYVAKMLYYVDVEQRMEEAIEAEVGEDLDIEDYARRTFSYVEIDLNGYTDEDGEYVEYTEEEAAEALAEAKQFAEQAKDDFDGAAEEYGYTVSTYSYGEDEASEDAGGFSEAVIEEADTMREGDVSGLIDAGDTGYVIRMDSEDDEEAAESAMESASSEIKSEHYQEVCDAYLDDTEIRVDEALWAKVKFTDLFTVEETEAEE